MTGKEEQELYENICNDINCGTFILAPRYVNKLLAKLEKENAELKKDKEELCHSINEAGKACVYLNERISKAKDLLAKWVELYKPKSETALPTPIQVETEQFLNSELQSKWINPARITNDSEIKLNSEVEK